MSSLAQKLIIESLNMPEINILNLTVSLVTNINEVEDMKFHTIPSLLSISMIPHTKKFLCEIILTGFSIIHI